MVWHLLVEHEVAGHSVAHLASVGIDDMMISTLVGNGELAIAASNAHSEVAVLRVYEVCGIITLLYHIVSIY